MGMSSFQKSEQYHMAQTYGLSLSLTNAGLLIGHPVDRLKVASQLNRTKPSFVLLKEVFQGGVTEVYSGLKVALLRQNIKPLYRTYLSTGLPNTIQKALEPQKLNPFAICMITSAAISAIDSTLSTPLEVLKIQLMKEGNAKGGMFANIKCVATASGLKGFYSGWLPGVLKTYPVWLNFLYAYHVTIKNVEKEKVNAIKIVAAATIASFPITFVTTPFDVVKSAMNASASESKNAKLGFSGTAMKIIRHDGAFTLWRGLWFRMVHRSLNTAIGFVIINYYDTRKNTKSEHP